MCLVLPVSIGHFNILFAVSGYRIRVDDGHLVMLHGYARRNSHFRLKNGHAGSYSVSRFLLYQSLTLNQHNCIIASEFPQPVFFKCLLDLGLCIHYEGAATFHRLTKRLAGNDQEMRTIFTSL